MADLQTQFLAFHKNIRLGTYDEDASLRAKRDLLLDDLREKLKEEKVPDTQRSLTFTKLDQGSYAMRTGIKPVNGDYDIDVGVVFDINNDEYDSKELKTLVFDALNKTSARTVIYNRPCVTVSYADGYHADLAIYASNSDDHHIAWGKKTSFMHEWEKSDPKGLKKWVADVSSDEDEAAQYRRCVRYLKKWKSLKFTAGGNEAPPSIGLTVQARKHFHFFEGDDQRALHWVVARIIEDFDTAFDLDSLTFKKSLEFELPVEPYSNIYAKMTLNQTDKMHSKLEDFRDLLKETIDLASKEDASEILNAFFGDDFPIKKEARVSAVKPFVNTGNSA